MRAAIIILFFILILTGRKPMRLLKIHTLREDSSGSGRFGASRGNRTHKGVDLEVTKGEEVYSPFSGVIVRTTRPYADDAKYKGIVLKSDSGIEMKIFYMNPSVSSGRVSKGQVIGYAQAISEKYGGSMKDHIHVEIRKKGILQNPEKELL